VAKRDLGKKYVGLTDDQVQRRQQHGNPRDWWYTPFAREAEARAWEQAMLKRPNHVGGPGGAGWRYGYTYTITDSTVE